MPEPARLKRVSDALRAASKVFDTTGEVFFRSLTEHLNDVLHVDFVSIGELTDDGRHIRTVAVSAEGRNLENLEYELAHTPCQQALEHGRYFDHHDVHRFPLDEFLVQMGFQSISALPSRIRPAWLGDVRHDRHLADPQTAELTSDCLRRAPPSNERRSERALQERGAESRYPASDP